jgi:polyketide synthase PksN
VIDQQPVDVQIALELQENEEVVFTIRSQVHGTEDEGPVHSLGRAEAYMGKEVVSHVDLAAVQARCQHLSLEAPECYQRYRECGMRYGPAMQGIEQLRVGEGEVLARLHLPMVVAQTHADRDKPSPYVLHPSLLDSALQACIGFLLEPGEQQELQVPFALDEVLIVREIPAQSWAWVRRRSSRLPTGAVGSLPISVFDLDICDDEGRVAVRLRGLNTRVLYRCSIWIFVMMKGASRCVCVA